MDIVPTSNQPFPPESEPLLACASGAEGIPVVRTLHFGSFSKTFATLSAWRVKGKRAKRASGSQELREVLESLASLSPVLEAAFLELGDRVMKMDDCGRGLVKRCDQLLDLVQDPEHGANLLRQTVGTLQKPLGYIDSCIERQLQLQQLLSQCETKTQAMLEVQYRMHDAIAPLNVMAVLFKIESAYLATDLRDTFSSVNLEVERIHKLVDDTFAQHTEELRSAYQTLKTVRIRFEAEFREQIRHISEKRTSIDAAMVSMGRKLEEGAGRDEQVRGRCSRLTVELGRVVTGLQFQDIVKQKCDHVSEALSNAQDGQASASMLALQARQLKAAERDLSVGCESVEAGLSVLGELTDGQQGGELSAQGFTGTVSAIEEMVQLLLDIYADVEEIIRVVARITEQGFEAVQPASSIAQNLSTTIGDLSMNMHLIALNAQVRSIQGGKGTGLEVLAARTADISTEIKSIGELVTSNLRSLHDTIGEMMTLFAGIRADGEEQLTWLSDNRPGAEVRLTGLRESTRAAAEALEREAKALGESSRAVCVSLSELPQQRDQFGAVADRLEAFAAKAASEGEIDHGELADHAKRYTMKSERDVHREILENAPASEREAVGVAATAAVETANDNPLPATSENGSGMGGNVELF